MMDKIIIDCAAVSSKEALHGILKQQLPLPEYYGNNLDALFDCLTEMPELNLTFTGLSALRNVLGFYGDVFEQVLRDAAENNSRLYLEIIE